MKIIFFIISLLFFSLDIKADDFEDIPGKLAIGASQSVRRNASNTAFEAYNSIPTPQPTATPQTIPATPTPLTLPLPLTQGGEGQSMAITTVTTTGTINNQAVTTGILRFTGNSPALTGLVSDGTAKKVILYNQASSGAKIQIYSENASSTAANRFSTPLGNRFYIPYQGYAEFFYDTVSSRWRTGAVAVPASPITYDYSGAFSLPQASASQAGYLSSSDWTTFSAASYWTRTASNIYPTSDRKMVLYGNGADDGSGASLQVYSASSCQGTSTACTSYNSDPTGCGNQPGCNYNYGNSCSAFNYEYGMSNCSSTSPCSPDTNSCAGPSDQYNCESQNNSYGGSCVWTDTMPSCSGFDETTCNSYSASGCTTNYFYCSNLTNSTDCGYHSGCSTNNTYCSWDWMSDCYGDPSCDSADNTDQMTCESISFFSSCSNTLFESCSGNYSSYSCANSYYTGNCSGNYGAACDGTAATCGSRVGSTQCLAVTGCSYTNAPAINADGDVITSSNGYLQGKKSGSSAPSSTDCDNASEIGRIYVRTGTTKLYICLGASGWYSTNLS